VISLVQTPTYRVRTSLEIQDFNAKLMDIKSVDPTIPTEATPHRNRTWRRRPRSCKSESLLERVIDKLNLDQSSPQPAAGLRVARTADVRCRKLRK